MPQTISTVHLTDFTSGDETRRAHFIQELGKSLEEFGFVAVLDHGLDWDLIDRCYDNARAAFALPEETKLRYETPGDGRQRGYTPFGLEHAKDQPVPDLKEFWHVGRDLPADHPLAVSGEVPPNRFPDEVPDFAVSFRAHFAAIENFANQLLEAVGLYLGQDAGVFREMVQDSNSVVRVIHYPDMGTVPAGAVRAASHEDINLLTVLPASTRPGLEILTRDGEWLSINTPPGVLICDSGDMMQLLTAGKLPATTHRVVNPEAADGGRLSMPFFLHPNPESVLTPFFASDATPIKAKEFLRQRLVEIGLI